MRLDHEEFSCNPPVPATTVSYGATPPNGQDLVENEGHGLAHVVATPAGQFGCGILKMMGPKMQDFCPRINMLKGFF